MQDAKERRLRRINNTPKGEATEGNAADDSLMVDQGITQGLIAHVNELETSSYQAMILNRGTTLWLKD